MLEDRKLAVLKAIVTDYVASKEPVGSKGLVERHALGVSSATIRNDMAALEEEGYITQPHTSAGRIPTDKGYRLFVDKIAKLKPLSPPERRAIQAFMTGAISLDDLMTRTVRALSQLTQQVAIVQYPSVETATVRHLELVMLTPTRLLVVLVTSEGQVDQRNLEIAEWGDDDLAVVRNRLVEAVLGQSAGQAARRISEAMDNISGRERALVAPVAAVVLELLARDRGSQVVVAGVPNLARFADNFETRMRPLLEALEEQVVLLRLLGEADLDSEVTVRIGSENSDEHFQETSLIATGYGSGGRPAAGIGVLGPTLMDYPATMASVHAVARYVSRFLNEE